MPTIILLDVSLSMSRPVGVADNSEEYQRRHLAIHGINTLLDHCASHTKLEFISLVVFSSLHELLVPFTRDYDSIKTALTKLEDYNKTCIEPALASVNSIVLEEWGATVPCQIVLITDGSMGFGEGSLQNLLQNYSHRCSDTKLPLPYPFPSKLHVVLVSTQNEPGQQTSLTMYQKLIEMNNGSGEIFQPDGALTLKSMEQLFKKLLDKYFKPYTGLLKCGNLKCNISLFPAPDPYKQDTDFEHVDKTVNPVIEICGFMDISDISSPPCISRHLALPQSLHEGSDDGKAEDDDAEGKSAPTFTVLLHGSLKVLGMVAITQLAEDWYGMMYSWADNKKKSNLMLSVFEPGGKALAWLGDLNNLAAISDFIEPPYGDEDKKTPFPVRPNDRRSYSQNCVVWIKPSGLQADIQKILRHARKLPEKQQHFYKELNRLRRAALSYGFSDLLEAVSLMLERECTLLPGTAPPDAALQLTHAANALRSNIVMDISQNILPMRTNFSSE